MILLFAELRFFKKSDLLSISAKHLIPVTFIFHFLLATKYLFVNFKSRLLNKYAIY